MAITLYISVSGSVTLDKLGTYLLPQAVFGLTIHICLGWKLKEIDFDWMGKKKSLWGQSNFGTGFLEDCVVPDCVDSLGFSKPGWEKAWEAWLELRVNPCFQQEIGFGLFSELLASQNKHVISIFLVCSWWSNFSAMSTFHANNKEETPKSWQVRYYRLSLYRECFFLNCWVLPHHLICWNVVCKIFAETTPALLSQRTQVRFWYLFKDGKH